MRNEVVWVTVCVDVFVGALLDYSPGARCDAVLAEVVVNVELPQQRPAAWELFLLILDNSDVRLFK